MGYKVISKGKYKSRGENYYGKSFRTHFDAINRLNKESKGVKRLWKKDRISFKIVKERNPSRSRGIYGMRNPSRSGSIFNPRSVW